MGIVGEALSNFYMIMHRKVESCEDTLYEMENNILKEEGEDFEIEECGHMKRLKINSLKRRMGNLEGKSKEVKKRQSDCAQK